MGFRIKEQGMRVKERGGVGEERKEGLADKPWEFESHPHGMSCLSAHTDINILMLLSAFIN